MERITVWTARIGFLCIATCTFGLSFGAIRDVAQNTGAVDPSPAHGARPTARDRADQIIAAVDAGEVPTQRQLATELNVPRSRVRRAIERNRDQWQELVERVDGEPEARPVTSGARADRPARGRRPARSGGEPAPRMHTVGGTP
jgi:hypothetical protein